MKNDIYAAIRRRALEAIGSRAETLNGQAKALLARRSALADASRAKVNLPQPWLLDRLPVGATIQLSDETRYGYRFRAISDNDVLERAAKVIGRCGQKSNYGPGSAVVYGKAHQTRWEKIQYRGKFKGYSGSHLNWDYQSCVGISRSGRSAVLIQECRLINRLRAPKGMEFAKDHNGILLRRLSDGMDYHPTLDDYRARNFATRCREAMATNYRRRLDARRAEKRAAADKKEAARIAAIMDREMASTRVTLMDSRAAGNCIEGSLKFAETRLNMDRDTILAAPWLVSVGASRVLATGDSLARRAVEAAFVRETTVSI